MFSKQLECHILLVTKDSKRFSGHKPKQIIIINRLYVWLFVEYSSDTTLAGKAAWLIEPLFPDDTVFKLIATAWHVFWVLSSRNHLLLACKAVYYTAQFGLDFWVFWLCYWNESYWAIGHFTVMDGSEANGVHVLIQTFLLYYVNQVILMLTSIFQGQFP